MTLDLQSGEQLYPRTEATVRAYNERAGAQVLTLPMLKHGLHEGTRTKSGARIRIASVRFGRKIYTTLQAIDRWATDVAAADLAHVGDASVAPGAPKTKAPIAPAARAQSDAEALLDEAGI